MAVPHLGIRNRPLTAMLPSDFVRLMPQLEPVTPKMKDVLVAPNEPILHVCFVEEGLASVIAISTEVQRIEVGAATSQLTHRKNIRRRESIETLSTTYDTWIAPAVARATSTMPLWGAVACR